YTKPASAPWLRDAVANATATFTGQAVTNATGDVAPVVDTAGIDQSAPTTNETLSASVTGHDADGDAVTYAYQWKRNGAAISGATGTTLDLSQAGAGDRGDTITLVVTPSDGVAN